MHPLFLFIGFVVLGSVLVLGIINLLVRAYFKWID